ncbi:MAG TPA: hypothetical protein VK995_01055, partial [Oceanipulchritudo sp.]|nr:hypothetical protein [Oceanipulchritudo sp.]
IVVNPSEVVSWINPAGGSWNTAANWLPEHVPGPTDRAVINLPGSYEVYFSANSTMANLTVGGAGVEATLRLNGRTLNLPNSSSVLAGSTLSLDSGRISLGNLADLVVTGTLDFQAGVITASTGRVIVGVGGTGTLSGTGNKYVDGILENRGVLTYNGSNFRFGSDTGNLPAMLVNATGGIINLEGTAGIGQYHSSPYYRFENDGMLVKRGVDTTTTITGILHFANTGEIQIEEGTLNFTGKSTMGGFSSGVGQMSFSDGTHTLQGCILQAPVQLSSATLTCPVNSSIETLTLQASNARLSVASGIELSITGNLDFQAGVITASDGKVVLETGGSGTLSGTGNKYVDGILENRGVLSYTGTNFRFGSDTGNLPARLVNAAGGVFNLTSGGGFSYYHSSPNYLIENAGLLIKESGGQSNFTVPFQNSGTIDLRAPHLGFARSFSMTSGSQILYTVNVLPGSPDDVARIQSTGSVALTGSLTLVPGGIIPEAGQSLSLLSAANLSGSFSSVLGGELGPVNLVPQQVGNVLFLVAQEAVPAQAAGDEILPVPLIKLLPDGTWLVTVDLQTPFARTVALLEGGDPIAPPKLEYSYDLNSWIPLSLPAMPMSAAPGTEAGLLEFRFIPPSDGRAVFMRVSQGTR